MNERDQGSIFSKAKTSPQPLGREHSGRAFVIVAVIALLAAWGGLFLAFSRWKAQYREDKIFGEREVATTVDLLAKLEPPGIDRGSWTQAVADTHAMLAVVTASGMLDRPALELLRNDLRDRFAKSTPQTAVNDLSKLWDDMQERAGPILTRDPERLPAVPRRPKILEKLPDVQPLSKK